MLQAFQRRLVATGYQVLNPLRLAVRKLWYPITVGVRAIVENEDGHILFVRHTYMDGWYFPGGGVKRRETVRTGLHRELCEEVGVTVTGPIELFGVYSNFHGYKSDHIALFVVRNYDMSFRANQEIAEYRFFHPAQLPDGIRPGTLARLEEYRGLREKAFEW